MKRLSLLALTFTVACSSPNPTPMDSEVSGDSAEVEMVDILDLDSTFVLDIRYATDQNFTGKAVYSPEEARCLLRRPVAEALVAVQADLKTEGYGLMIYDCFRPISVQQRFWEVYPDEDYVAKPVFDADGRPIQGSKHNRGAAVDLTLLGPDGLPVEMPTDYDDFSEKAHPGNTGMSEAARANVDRLSQAMQRHGFTPIATEWWHFDGPDWEKYGLQ